jgi:peroxiredoxin
MFPAMADRNTRGEKEDIVYSLFYYFYLLMKLLFKYFFFICFLAVASCNEKHPYGDALVKPAVILKNQTNFVNYWYTAMNLCDDFIGLDMFSKKIPKGLFLKQVASGDFLPVRLISDSSSTYYQLFKIKPPVDNYIIIMLKAIGAEAYKNFEWEGEPLPQINYTALDGKKYDASSLKGKIVVLDFWFIGCTSCVHEMPQLNALKAQYSNRQDMLFGAIAFDKENALRNFMKKTDFQYDIISDTAAYLVKQLGISSFPTQVVIKDGIVVKILDDQYHSFEALKSVLKKETNEARM